MNTHDKIELPPLPTPDADHYDSGTFTPVWKKGKMEAYALAAIEAYRKQQGEVVVTKDESGAIVAVTRQDVEGRILSVIAVADRKRIEALDNVVRSSRSVDQLKEALQDRSQRFTASYSEVKNLIGFYEAALQSQDREDAERYRWLLGKFQQSYDGEDFESDSISIYSRMASQCKGVRTIKAEIFWRDKTDEPIGLSEAIDHARRIED